MTKSILCYSYDQPIKLYIESDISQLQSLTMDSLPQRFIILLIFTEIATERKETIHVYM